MDKLNISKSILSISSPGTHLTRNDHAAARDLTRSCNDFMANLTTEHPERLGFWASLPLPDVEGSLKEIARVIDTKNANGIAIETNHHGTYLGDRLFDPVFDELNRRHAKVFIHPTTPCAKHDGEETVKATPLNQFPVPMFEFLFDTARAVINLFLSGTIARCPNITFVIPHAGGTLPTLIERFTSFGHALRLSDTELTSQIVKETLQKQFYFDLAGFPFPSQVKGLLEYVPVDKLLYGSDYPFTPEPAVLGLAKAMDNEMKVLWNEVERKLVYLDNARRLLA